MLNWATWLLLLAILVTIFILLGGLRSQTAIIVLVVGLVSGVLAAFFFTRRR